MIKRNYDNLPAVCSAEDKELRHYLLAIFRKRKISGAQFDRERGRIAKHIDNEGFDDMNARHLGDHEVQSNLEKSIHQYDLMMNRDLRQEEINKIHREFKNCNAMYIGKNIGNVPYPVWQRQFYYVSHGLTKEQKRELEKWIEKMIERKNEYR
jgi:hypothetical protein